MARRCLRIVVLSPLLCTRLLYTAVHGAARGRLGIIRPRLRKRQSGVLVGIAQAPAHLEHLVTHAPRRLGANRLGLVAVLELLGQLAHAERIGRPHAPHQLLLARHQAVAPRLAVRGHLLGRQRRHPRNLRLGGRNLGVALVDGLLDETLPPRAQVPKGRLHVDPVAKRDRDLFAGARNEAREAAVLVHHVAGSVDEHGDHVGHGLGLEDEAGDAPLEVAHLALRVLVHQALGKDVHPGVAVQEVGRGGNVHVAAGGGVGEAAVGEGVLEGFEEVAHGGLLGVDGGGEGRVLARHLVGVGGEETDGLGHARLEEPGVRRVHSAVNGEDLAEGEEGAKGSVLEADVVGTKAPAKIPGLEGEADWEDAPY